MSPERASPGHAHIDSAHPGFSNARVARQAASITTGSTTVNRKGWGLTWNAALETGGVLVSERIKLELDVSAIATPDEV